MGTQVGTRPVSADELLQSGDRWGRSELVRGELIQMAPAGGEHGEVAANVLAPLQMHVKQHKLGKTYGAETGFLIERNPDTVRAPDAAFVRADRLPPGRVRGFVPVAPDFLVEVLSPDDRSGDVLSKVQMWLAAGCPLVWVVDPQSRTVTAYHAGGAARVHGGGETLDAGDAVPGFRIPLADVFGA